MKSLPIHSIEEVCAKQLCTGCGACASVEPDRFYMDDAPEYGKRPFVRSESVPESGAGLRVCPGIHLEHNFDRSDPDLLKELTDGWGPVLEVWEGHAAADDIRFAGSSGGAASALALFCIEKAGMDGCLHTASQPEQPHRNESVYSTSREEMLARAGSRYAPASPCDSLHLIEKSENPSVFIGKPCDVAAVQKAREVRPGLNEKLGLTIAFFCAGTPSTKGTVELMKKVGIDDLNAVRNLRYRGNGWPGMWTVQWEDNGGQAHQEQLTYAESWGFLQRYRQWRCYICPDHTGEFADIAVGDPWYREIEPGEPGKSLILARTPRGKEILHAAVAAGYIHLDKQDPTLLPRSQPNLLATRGALWGRLVALKFFRAPTPQFKGFETFLYWRRTLSLQQKLQSLYGTAKRIFRKNLRRDVVISKSDHQSDA